MIVVAVLALLAVLAARVDAQPLVDVEDDLPDAASAPDPDAAESDALTDDDARPIPPGPRPPRRGPEAAPPISAVVAAAYRTAALDQDPGPGWRARTRLAGLVPWLGVRAGRDASWRDVTDPTVGYVSVLTVTATWHLDRLVFDPNELRISAIEAGRRRERRRIAELVIRAYYDWLATGAAEPAATLDALTDGWFTRALPRSTPRARVVPPPGESGAAGPPPGAARRSMRTAPPARRTARGEPPRRRGDQPSGNPWSSR